MNLSDACSSDFATVAGNAQHTCENHMSPSADDKVTRGGKNCSLPPTEKSVLYIVSVCLTSATCCQVGKDGETSASQSRKFPLEKHGLDYPVSVPIISLSLAADVEILHGHIPRHLEH